LTEFETTEIWRKYRRGVDYHERVGLYTRTERAHSFFEGRQWEGLEAGAKAFPSTI
jgi:hypothetical protein